VAEKENIKGCIIKGWCSEENIYNPKETTITKNQGISNVVLNISAELRHEDIKVVNRPGSDNFPSKHSRSLNAKKLLDQISISEKAYETLGTTVQINTAFKCIQQFSKKMECDFATEVSSLSYFGESIGFQWQQQSNVNYTSRIRDLDHYTGISFYATTSSEIKSFSILYLVWVFLTVA